ncbi:hypothetical protein AVEN_229707-1 [Araneus ventricosus]|uniref:Uncharacterized protein n=1 Tax=Araneus ventricosus TaxID=182803 RepID=A0A4Y2R7K1_ARAVE|nr:hypothetical protein AVEN_229707-1 [Araneus ventricosus]
MDTSPVAPLRKRRRPPKITVLPRATNQEPSSVSKATSKGKPLTQRNKKPQTSTGYYKSSQISQSCLFAGISAEPEGKGAVAALVTLTITVTDVRVSAL